MAEPTGDNTGQAAGFFAGAAALIGLALKIAHGHFKNRRREKHERDQERKDDRTEDREDFSEVIKRLEGICDRQDQDIRRLREDNTNLATRIGKLESDHFDCQEANFKLRLEVSQLRAQIKGG
jgi:hypothetical protein